MVTRRTLASARRGDRPPDSAPGRRAADGVDAVERAYRQIREAIANLTFEPGQHLQEAFLAHWLGLSRTPVREALRRLERDGLVAPGGVRGIVVAQVTIEDIEQAYLLLEVLEGLASRLAAHRLTKKDEAGLRRLLEEMRAATARGDFERWAQLDAELHDAIRAIAGSPKLSDLVGLVYPVIDRVRNTYLLDGSDPDHRARLLTNHVAMGEAVLARDPDRAETLTRRLFAEGGQANVALLRRWISPLRRSF